MARVVTAILYFLILLRFNKFKDRFVLIFLLTLIIADVFNVYYENPICRKLTSLFKLSGYLLLIYKIISKVRFMKPNNLFKILFLAIICINLSGAIYLITSVSNKTNDVIELILLIIYGIVLISLCSVAANYNFRYNTRRSTYFLYFSFGLLFTDLFAFLGYFLSYEYFFYGTRLFYIGTLFFIVLYALYTKEEEDVLLVEQTYSG